MDLTFPFAIVAPVLLFGIVLLAGISYISRAKYSKSKILTPSELEFYHVLTHAAYPHYQVFPQVRLANIVHLKNTLFLWEQFRPIGAKCVDFVLVDAQTGETELVVELDDSSHLRKDRRKRDKFVDSVLKEANIPILHQKWQNTYKIDELKQKIKMVTYPNT